MPDRDPRSIAVCAAVALAVLVLAGWYFARRQNPSHGGGRAAPAPAISLATPAGGRLVVDVAGAVRRPGVYRLSAGARVEDALRRAGGARRGADLTQINRAAKLEDGRQVLVPERASAAAASAAPGASSAATAAGGTAPAVPLNLNTATLAQLDQLDGVGPATAQKIIDFRRAHGGFASVDELNQVPGIGDKRLAALRDHVRV